MNEAPLVSVVIPTYNRSLYLKQAIESVQGQTYDNWELVIIDDGSTDDTFDIVKKYSERDKRIKYFRQENAGVAAARNAGISQSHGVWIAFLDDDDCWFSHKLDMQMKFLAKNPRVRACMLRRTSCKTKRSFFQAKPSFARCC